MAKRPILFWLAGIAGLCLIAFVALALSLPRIIDSEAVKDRVRSFIAGKMNGSARLDKLEFAWLPRPVVVIAGAGISLADNDRATIETVEVYPSLLELLAGRIAITRVVLRRPALVLGLSERPEKPLDLDQLERDLRAWLTRFRSEFPEITFAIEAGSAEIAIGNRSPVVIHDIHAELNGSSDGLGLEIAARSNLCDALRFDGRLAEKNLAVNGRLAVEKLHLGAAMASFLPRLPGYIEGGELNLTVRLAGVGLKELKAEIAGSLPSLVVRGPGGKATIEGKALEGVVAYGAGSARAAIERLDIVAPRLSVAGEFTADLLSPDMTLKLTARGADVAAVRDAALKIAGDNAAVATLFDYVRGGTIPELHFESGGRSLGEMASIRKIALRAKLSDGKIHLPDLAHDVENAGVSLAVLGGRLGIEEAGGAIGRSSFAGLTAAVSFDAPRRLEIKAGRGVLDLEEAAAALKKSGAAEKYLAGVQSARGRVEIVSLKVDGPLTSPRQWDFRAAGRVADASLAHSKLPGPIVLRTGNFEASPQRIALTGAAATMLDASLSSFAGVLELPEKQQPRLEATATGTIGTKANEWIKRAIDLPGELTLRAPFQVADGRVRWNKIGESSFQGKLALENGLRAAVDVSKSPQALTVNNFTVDDGARSARLSLKQVKSELDVSFKGALDLKSLGRILQAPPIEGGLLQGDIDVGASLEKPYRLSVRGKLEGQTAVFPWLKEKAVADNFLVEGQDGGAVRLAAESFTHGRFNFKPLRLRATVSSAGIGGVVEQAAVCGIRATGRIDASEAGVSYDLRLTAKDDPLEAASICLTDERQDLTGTFSLDAQIAGRGDADLLKKSSGKFEFVARDGAFVRSAAVDATFDYLNGTGDFKIAFPDLDKEAFPFRLLSAKGTLQGETIVGDEVIIQSSALTMAGQGRVDLGRQQVDAQFLVYTATPWEQSVRRIPVIGFVLGGSLLGIPVRITGPLEKPNVSYLSPSALGSALLNIPARILGFPPDTVRILNPAQPEAAGK